MQNIIQIKLSHHCEETQKATDTLWMVCIELESSPCASKVTCKIPTKISLKHPHIIKHIHYKKQVFFGEQSYIEDSPEAHHWGQTSDPCFTLWQNESQRNYQRNIDWLWNHSHVTEKGESQPSCLALVESRLLTLSFRSCYNKSCSIIAGGSPRRCRFCRWSYLGVWMSSASKSLASVHPIHLLVEIAGLLETGDRHLGCQRSFEDSPQTRRLWGMRLCVQSLHSLEALATCWCHHQGWHSQWERYKKMMCGQEKCNYPG